jgi:hypothetical protein
MIKKLALTATLAASAALPACNVAHAADAGTCKIFLGKSSPLPVLTVPKAKFSITNGVVTVKEADGSVAYYFDVEQVNCGK